MAAEFEGLWLQELVQRALERLDLSATAIAANLHRLLTKQAWGDWGDLTPEDIEANEKALAEGGRIVSAHDLEDGTRVWVITEWDRSTTTILLPSEH